MTFLGTSTQALAIMLILGSPLFIVAGKLRRTNVMVKFLGIAIILAALIAGMEATSDLLVERCRESGNTGCMDYGASGGWVIAVGGFTAAAWIRARNLWRPF